MRYLEDERMLLLPADTGLAEELAAYCLRNREFLKEFEPLREEIFYTAQHQKQLLEEDIKHWNEKTGFRFYIKRKEDHTAIIGSIGINNVIWGAFCSGMLGAKLDKDYINQGYITDALALVTDFAFGELGLHRLEANVMPRNKRSLRTLEKNQFVNEGLSRHYLKINGVWEDHVHMVKLNETMHSDPKDHQTDTCNQD